MMSLWDKLLGRPVHLYIHEDNQATIEICKKGFSNKLRHITRTHGVNLGSIKDEIVKPVVHLDYIDTTLQAADIFTKALEPHKWQRALDMLNIVPGPLPKWVDQNSLRASLGGS
jgi:hypothetical protein